MILMSVSERERERNVLFNDALNTFYLWLYGVRHMVKDRSDSEKGNLLPPHRLLFIKIMWYFIVHHAAQHLGLHKKAIVNLNIFSMNKM